MMRAFSIGHFTGLPRIKYVEIRISFIVGPSPCPSPSKLRFSLHSSGSLSFCHAPTSNQPTQLHVSASSNTCRSLPPRAISKTPSKNGQPKSKHIHLHSPKKISIQSKTMINIAALALLISSLAAAGVWSPPPPSPQPSDPHLIREGHRIVVVEYERHLPSQIPPPPTTTPQNLLEEAKEKFQEASSYFPNVGQGLSKPESVPTQSAHSAKNLICDAYGSCKEKISSALPKSKDKISRKASDIEENAKERAQEMEESVKDAVKSKMEKAREIEENAKESAHSAKDMICDAYGSCKEKISSAFSKGKDKISRKASDIEETAKEKAREIEESVKDTVKGAINVTREAERDAVGNISRAVEKAEEAANMLHQNFTDILHRARDVVFDVASYFKAPENARVVASIAHLLGFSLAYGTCVWVTFVSSHVLATALPRQQFGMVQSKLYPVYFRAAAYGVGLACLGHFFEKERVVGVERVQGYNLVAALGLVLLNMFYLEPRATKVMFERMKMEKEEGRGRDISDMLGDPPVMTASTATTTTTVTPQSTATIGVTRTTMSVDQEAVKGRVVKLNKKLKKLNTYSSFVNVLTLMSLTWHLVHLSRRLQMTCR